MTRSVYLQFMESLQQTENIIDSFERSYGEDGRGGEEEFAPILSTCLDPLMEAISRSSQPLNPSAANRWLPLHLGSPQYTVWSSGSNNNTHLVLWYMGQKIMHVISILLYPIVDCRHYCSSIWSHSYISSLSISLWHHLSLLLYTVLLESSINTEPCCLWFEMQWRSWWKFSFASFSEVTHFQSLLDCHAMQGCFKGRNYFFVSFCQNDLEFINFNKKGKPIAYWDLTLTVV